MPTDTEQNSGQNQDELMNNCLSFKSNSEVHKKPPELVNKLERLRVLGRDNIDKYGVNWTNHSLCTLPVQSLSRLFYYNELYKKILDVPGVICEFGVQWGAGLSQLLNLRNLYEAHNMSRVIYGFDTFDGFEGVTKSDGNLVSDGDYKTETNYFSILEEIVSIHESFQPRPEIKRTSLIKGDASKTVDNWLSSNPHAIISMAIFDMDIYQPTKDVLEKIIPRLTCGSLLVFDELNCPEFPGETLALNEVLGINNVALRKTPFQPYGSYCVWS